MELWKLHAARRVPLAREGENGGRGSDDPEGQPRGQRRRREESSGSATLRNARGSVLGTESLRLPPRVMKGCERVTEESSVIRRWKRFTLLEGCIYVRASGNLSNNRGEQSRRDGGDGWSTSCRAVEESVIVETLNEDDEKLTRG